MTRNWRPIAALVVVLLVGAAIAAGSVLVLRRGITKPASSSKTSPPAATSDPLVATLGAAAGVDTLTIEGTALQCRFWTATQDRPYIVLQCVPPQA